YSLGVALSTGSRASRAVAEILSKGGVVFLHSSCGATIAVTHRPVDHIKACLSLIQSQLVVGRQRRIGKIHCAPFNVEYPIRRGTRHRGVNTACATRVPRAANPP